MKEAKSRTEAQWAALFEMDRNMWHVKVLAGEKFLKVSSTEIGAQGYLPNGPVRDLSYQEQDYLCEGHAGERIPRLRNLLRFFGQQGIHSPVFSAAFQSAAAVRPNIGTAKCYTLWVIHPQAERFSHETLTMLRQEGLKAELVIVKQIHSRLSLVNQPFYLEGLARVGLRHDTIMQLTDIRMLAMAAEKYLQRRDTENVRKKLTEIRELAKAAHVRLDASLRQCRSESMPGDINVGAVVGRAASLAEGVAANWRRMSSTPTGWKKATINICCPEDLPLTIHGDANALQRLLENILVNAVEHGMAFCRQAMEVRIEIQATQDPKYPVAVLIHDNGPGIHGAYKPHIFDPLFSTKENGYGMGLAVVDMIAKDYGLEVEVAESAVLIGTTFIVRLPRQMTPQYTGNKI